jgi:hypothetical protein
MLGRRYRAMSEKHIQLALFSAQHKDKRATEQMREWNHTFGKWKYKELSNFSRDCEVAKRRLLAGGGYTTAQNDSGREAMLKQLGGGRRGKISLPSDQRSKGKG